MSEFSLLVLLSLVLLLAWSVIASYVLRGRVRKLATSVALLGDAVDAQARRAAMLERGQQELGAESVARRDTRRVELLRSLLTLSEAAGRRGSGSR